MPWLTCIPPPPQLTAVALVKVTNTRGGGGGFASQFTCSLVPIPIAAILSAPLDTVGHFPPWLPWYIGLPTASLPTPCHSPSLNPLPLPWLIVLQGLPSLLVILCSLPEQSHPLPGFQLSFLCCWLQIYSSGLALSPESQVRICNGLVAILLGYPILKSFHLLLLVQVSYLNEWQPIDLLSKTENTVCLKSSLFHLTIQLVTRCSQILLPIPVTIAELGQNHVLSGLQARLTSFLVDTPVSILSPNSSS